MYCNITSFLRDQRTLRYDIILVTIIITFTMLFGGILICICNIYNRKKYSITNSCKFHTTFISYILTILALTIIFLSHIDANIIPVKVHYISSTIKNTTLSVTVNIDTSTSSIVTTITKRFINIEQLTKWLINVVNNKILYIDVYCRFYIESAFYLLYIIFYNVFVFSLCAYIVLILSNLVYNCRKKESTLNINREGV